MDITFVEIKKKEKRKTGVGKRKIKNQIVEVKVLVGNDKRLTTWK